MSQLGTLICENAFGSPCQVTGGNDETGGNDQSWQVCCLHFEWSGQKSGISVTRRGKEPGTDTG
jgi:hypothetical protein